MAVAAVVMADIERAAAAAATARANAEGTMVDFKARAMRAEAELHHRNQTPGEGNDVLTLKGKPRMIKVVGSGRHRSTDLSGSAEATSARRRRFPFLAAVSALQCCALPAVSAAFRERWVESMRGTEWWYFFASQCTILFSASSLFPLAVTPVSAVVLRHPPGAPLGLRAGGGCLRGRWDGGQRRNRAHDRAG
jgi:hypothetical protein